MSATPDTNVLANVYQLYMVLYQWASMLISHNQGMEDITVSAKTIINRAAATVFLNWNLYFCCAFSNGASSVWREILRMRQPKKDQRITVSTVVMVKKVGFKNPFLKSKTLSCSTWAASVQ